MPRKHNRTGRSNGGERHIRLPLWILRHDAYRALSSHARSALIEILAFYNGGNNGFIAAPVRLMADRMGVSPGTAARALRELDDIGFIKPERIGTFRLKDRKASEYRITWIASERDHRKKTVEFTQYVPAAKKGDSRCHRRNRTVQRATQEKENYPPQSHGRNREGHSGGADSLMGETQLSYHMGCGDTPSTSPSIAFDTKSFPGDGGQS